MAELEVGSGEDQLLKSLDYHLPSIASYVLQRRLTQWQPSGANSYNPLSGQHAARIVPAGLNSWLDPTSLRIGFRLTNNDSERPLILASGRHV